MGKAYLNFQKYDRVRATPSMGQSGKYKLPEFGGECLVIGKASQHKQHTHMILHMLCCIYYLKNNHSIWTSASYKRIGAFVIICIRYVLRRLARAPFMKLEGVGKSYKQPPPLKKKPTKTPSQNGQNPNPGVTLNYCGFFKNYFLLITVSFLTLSHWPKRGGGSSFKIEFSIC